MHFQEPVSMFVNQTAVMSCNDSIIKLEEFIKSDKSECNSQEYSEQAEQIDSSIGNSIIQFNKELGLLTDLFLGINFEDSSIKR